MRLSSRSALALGVLLGLATSAWGAAAPDIPLAQTAPTAAPTSVTQAAYQQALFGLFPADPEMIREYLHRIDETRRAIHPGPAPKLVRRTLRLAVTPGDDIATLHITPGYVSALTFVDATGEPWPIESVSVGNPQWFSVAIPSTDAGNQLVVSALGAHLTSNMTIGLEGEPTPIAIKLSTDKTLTDAVVVARMNVFGPNAKEPTFVATTQTGVEQVMTAFMNDTPPPEARKMVVDNDGAEIWQYQGHYYLRTAMTALWPAWDAATSLAGVHVYRMPQTYSLLLSDNGQSVRVEVSAPPAYAPAAAKSAGAQP